MLLEQGCRSRQGNVQEIALAIARSKTRLDSNHDLPQPKTTIRAYFLVAFFFVLFLAVFLAAFFLAVFFLAFFLAFFFLGP